MPSYPRSKIGHKHFVDNYEIVAGVKEIFYSECIILNFFALYLLQCTFCFTVLTRLCFDNGGNKNDILHAAYFYMFQGKLFSFIGKKVFKM